MNHLFYFFMEIDFLFKLNFFIKHFIIFVILNELILILVMKFIKYKVHN